MNAPQTEIYGVARTNADKSKLYVIQNVTPATLVLLDTETGEEVNLKARDIADIEVDRESGEFVLDVKL
jgi:hypothetical protein